MGVSRNINCLTMSLLLLFKQGTSVDSTYELFNQYTPSKKNRVLGVITETGLIYCRVDIDKYHIEGNTKDITYWNTLKNIYNCVKCGYEITLTNHRIRYEKRHKIGKRGYN